MLAYNLNNGVFLSFSCIILSIVALLYQSILSMITTIVTY